MTKQTQVTANHTNTRHNNDMYTHSKINDKLKKNNVNSPPKKMNTTKIERNSQQNKLRSRKNETNSLHNNNKHGKKTQLKVKQTPLTCYFSRTTFEAKPGRTGISRTLLEALPPSLFFRNKLSKQIITRLTFRIML